MDLPPPLPSPLHLWTTCYFSQSDGVVFIKVELVTTTEMLSPDWSVRVQSQ